MCSRNAASNRSERLEFFEAAQDESDILPYPFSSHVDQLARTFDDREIAIDLGQPLGEYTVVATQFERTPLRQIWLKRPQHEVLHAVVEFIGVLSMLVVGKFVVQVSHRVSPGRDDTFAAPEVDTTRRA